MPPLTLLHVDSDPLHCAWLMERLRSKPEFSYLGSVRTGKAALEFCWRCHPAIVVLELSLPDSDGLRVAEELQREGSAPRILLFTATANDWTLFRISRSAIAGVVWKTSDAAHEFDAALDDIRRGMPHFQDATRIAITALRSKPDAFFKILSDRELGLLPLFGQSLPDDEVGRMADVSPLTARYHRQSIMRKLGIHTRHELIAWCHSKGFVSSARPAAPCEMSA